MIFEWNEPKSIEVPEKEVRYYLDNSYLDINSAMHYYFQFEEESIPQEVWNRIKEYFTKIAKQMKEEENRQPKQISIFDQYKYED